MNGRRLHIGCGRAILPGWVNIDIEALPGVDRVLDVRDGLPFVEVEYIFAEHFIEHLDFRSGLDLLRECRRVLTGDGVLRLSTPNLDWVWLNQYHFGAWTHDRDSAHRCRRGIGSCEFEQFAFLRSKVGVRGGCQGPASKVIFGTPNP